MGKYGSSWFKSRRNTIERDEFRCYFCGTTKNLHVHHIVPISMGGTNEDHNLVTLCQKCHVSAHDVIREDGLATIPGPDFEPHRDKLVNKNDEQRYFKKLGVS